MITRELKRVLIDRFEAFELCEILGVEVEDFIDRFEDLIEESEDELRELTGLDENDDDGGY